MAEKKILLFIPMYNCAPQIGRVLASITPQVQLLFSEVLVVDNRSTDGSVQQAIAGGAHITNCKFTVVRNTTNVSLGGSHKVAFAYLKEHNYNALVVLHGDDQGSVADLVPYLKDGSAWQYDCFLGARFASGSKLFGYSSFRTIGNRVFNAAISLLLGGSITDMGSGLNFYRAEFLKGDFFYSFPDDLTWNVYLLYYAVWQKNRLAFFPLSWREEDQVSNAKVFRQGWRIIKLTAAYMRSPLVLTRRHTTRLPADYSAEVMHRQGEVT